MTNDKNVEKTQINKDKSEISINYTMTEKR